MSRAKLQLFVMPFSIIMQNTWRKENFTKIRNKHQIVLTLRSRLPLQKYRANRGIKGQNLIWGIQNYFIEIKFLNKCIIQESMLVNDKN